jgi:hypothetical protein
VNSNTSSPAQRWLVALLRVALVLALAGAGWLIYSRLPHDDDAMLGGGGGLGAARQTRDTLLRIIIRADGNSGAQQQPGTAAVIPVLLYSVDVAAAQREFYDERRPGMRFEDFIVRRMGTRQPVRTQLDANGQTIVYVPPGRWWIHATREEGEQEISWRLPVNVAGREQTVELNGANAYMRTKRF